MSTQKSKGHYLPPLQKRVVLHLAKRGAQTINETVTGIKGHYKSSWISFNALEKKKLVKKIDVKNYRGNNYPRFWLSVGGVLIALLEGASSQDLLEKTAKVYPNDEVLQLVLEMAPFTGVEGYRIGLSAILAKGKLEESDAITIIMTQMEKDLSAEQFNQVLELLKKHPAQYKELTKQIDQLTKLLQKMKDRI